MVDYITHFTPLKQYILLICSILWNLMKSSHRPTMLDENFVISNSEQSKSFTASSTSLAFISIMSAYIRK